MPFDPTMSIYNPLAKIDFSIITNSWRQLAFFDDMYLGMQGMNLGLSDSVITSYEYNLLKEYFEIEKTPLDSALLVGAFSQMWVFATYELMRLWRDRRYKCKKWYENGGLDLAIQNLTDEDSLNLSKNIRKRQLEVYRDDESFREKVDKDWDHFEPIYRLVELYRMNLAKHAAPGKDSVIPRAPGYGRINMHCGALDYELVDKDEILQIVNRREIAKMLRTAFKEMEA